MNPLVWGPLIGAIPMALGSWLLYRQTTAANRGTEKLEVVKIQIDGWERLHNADLAENERLKLALIEERVLTGRLESEVKELRARLAERDGNA